MYQVQHTILNRRLVHVLTSLKNGYCNKIAGQSQLRIVGLRFKKIQNHSRVGIKMFVLEVDNIIVNHSSVLSIFYLSKCSNTKRH